MKEAPTYQKTRGGYYTPESIADFLARWAIEKTDDRILDPSCGDGALLLAAARRVAQLRSFETPLSGRILGVELDPTEARSAQESLRAFGFPQGYAKVSTGDFFSSVRRVVTKDLFSEPEGELEFDVIIGNPPFIRYQNFPEEHREVAFELMHQAGLQPNRLSNAWVPFLVVSSVLLAPTGRLAMVIPAELLQVNYAAEVRAFLSNFFDRISLITFKRLLFDSIQQEVVLLLAEKSVDHSHGIRVLQLGSAEELTGYDHDTTLAADLKPLDHSADKWTQYFLTTPEIVYLRNLTADPRISTVRSCMEVDVGLVTGYNDFFVLDNKRVESLNLEAMVEPLVSRSAQLSGLTFLKSDWERHEAAGAPVYLFSPPPVPAAQLPSAARRYIKSGESEGVNTGYKCRIRKHWHAVPSQWIPDGFMLRQVHSHPKLVVNRSGATATDTIHRVRFTNGQDPAVVAAAFFNSLTFAFSEIRGRSYGGGVLTFEPSEVESLPLPLHGAERLPVAELDTLVREGKTTEALNITDRILLRDGLGLSIAEIGMLRSIWERLRDRRTNRRRD